MSNSFIEPVSRETSRMSPVSAFTAYSAGGAGVSVPVSQISLPSLDHDMPLMPWRQPRAMAVGFAAAPVPRTTTSSCPPRGSRNATRPSEAMRSSCSWCSVS